MRIDRAASSLKTLSLTLGLSMAACATTHSGSHPAEGTASAAVNGTTTGTPPPPPTTCYTASNYAHTMAGRAYALYGYTYAYGSNQSMGLWNIYATTTLKMTGTNYYVIGTCP